MADDHALTQPLVSLQPGTYFRLWDDQPYLFESTGVATVSAVRLSDGQRVGLGAHGDVVVLEGYDPAADVELQQRQRQFAREQELGLVFSTGGDIAGQEYLGYIAAHRGEKLVGRLLYTSSAELGEVGIRLIETAEDERQRNGTVLLAGLGQRLIELADGMPIDFGMLTEHGARLVRLLGRRAKNNPALAAAFPALTSLEPEHVDPDPRPARPDLATDLELEIDETPAHGLALEHDSFSTDH